MKRRGMLTIFLLLSIGIGTAWGQGFRSGVPVTPRSQHFGHRVPQQGFLRSGGQFLQSPTVTRSNPSWHNHFHGGSGQIIIHHSSPLQVIPRVSLPPGHSHQGRAPLVLHKAPTHFHGPRQFPKHRGVLIIDVPRFYGTSVTTQIIQTGARTDERGTAIPSSQIPGRVSGQLAPFDPTPREVVERLLVLAGLKEDDILYDLGSGDGRVVIAAAKKFGVKAVGFEIDPGLVKLARENVRALGLEELVEIRQQDFMTADLSPATVVTLYLSHEGNLALRPKLLNELRPGARVVSYTFDMGDWPPKIMETYRDEANDTHSLYFWTIAGPMVSYEPK